MRLAATKIAKLVTTTAIVLQPQFLKKSNPVTFRDHRQIPLAMSALEVGRTPSPRLGRRTTKIVDHMRLTLLSALLVTLVGCSTSPDIASYTLRPDCPNSDAVAQWKARLPQYSKQRIISEVLMGNPNARIMATGGSEQTVVRRDDDKKQIEVVINEAGNIVRAIDSSTGCDIGPAEYARRRVR